MRLATFRRFAARLAGVSPATLEKWLKRGDRGEQPYSDFAQAFYRSEDEGEAELVAIWKSKAPDDWRAAKELLAKRHGSRERWSEPAARRAVEDNADAAFRLAFQININLGDEAEYEKQWAELVRQRTLALERQKPVIETTATPAKESAPATPTVERYRIAPPKNPRDDDSDNNNGTPGNWN